MNFNLPFDVQSSMLHVLNMKLQIVDDLLKTFLSHEMSLKSYIKLKFKVNEFVCDTRWIIKSESKGELK